MVARALAPVESLRAPGDRAREAEGRRVDDRELPGDVPPPSNGAGHHQIVEGSVGEGADEPDVAERLHEAAAALVLDSNSALNREVETGEIRPVGGG